MYHSQKLCEVKIIVQCEEKFLKVGPTFHESRDKHCTKYSIRLPPPLSHGLRECLHTVSKTWEALPYRQILLQTATNVPRILSSLSLYIALYGMVTSTGRNLFQCSVRNWEHEKIHLCPFHCYTKICVLDITWLDEHLTCVLINENRLCNGSSLCLPINISHLLPAKENFKISPILAIYE